MLRRLFVISYCALIGSSAFATEPTPHSTQSVLKQPVLPVVRGVLDKLPGVSGAVTRLTTDDNPGLLLPLLEEPSGEVSPVLVQVRLSHEYLASFLERNVLRHSSVHETILGTEVVGDATTQGATQLVLHSSPDRAVIEVLLEGTVEARTIGRNGPVRMHSSSRSPFKSRKVIYLDADGIAAKPASTNAHTRSTTHQIRSTLPGLRGRIAERIGSNRAAQLHAQAEAIASRNTERRLNREFDRSVSEALKNARGAVQNKLVSLPIGKLADNWRYRSESGFVEMVLTNPDATIPLELPANSFETDAAIAVRIHRNAVRRALTDNNVRESLQPLLASIMSHNSLEPAGEKQPDGIAAQSVSVRNAPEFRVSWSRDCQWLEFHFTPAAADLDSKLAVSGQ
jgi:hypothetical protein